MSDVDTPSTDTLLSPSEISPKTQPLDDKQSELSPETYQALPDPPLLIGEERQEMQEEPSSTDISPSTETNNTCQISLKPVQESMKEPTDTNVVQTSPVGTINVNQSLPDPLLTGTEMQQESMDIMGIDVSANVNASPPLSLMEANQEMLEKQTSIDVIPPVKTDTGKVNIPESLPIEQGRDENEQTPQVVALIDDEPNIFLQNTPQTHNSPSTPTTSPNGFPATPTKHMDSLNTPVTSPHHDKASDSLLFSEENLSTTLVASGEETTSRLRKRSQMNYKEGAKSEESSSCGSDDEFLDSQDVSRSPLTSNPTLPQDFSNSLNAIELTTADTCKPYFKRNKKSKKISLLGLDEFLTSCVTNKEAKLRTETPYRWYLAFKAHVQTHNVVNRVELKTHKNHKVSIMKLRLVSMDNKDVAVSLNFVSGVLHVKCINVMTWIDKDFALISTNYTHMAHPAPPMNKPHICIDSKNKNDDGKEPRKKERKETETEKDKNEIENIWLEIDCIKTALKTIEESVGALDRKIERIEESCQRSSLCQENKIKDVSENLYSTISTYEDSLAETTKKEVSNLTKDVNNKIHHIKVEVKKLEVRVDEKLRDADNTINVQNEDENKITTSHLDKLRTQTESVQANIQGDLNKLDLHYETKFTLLDKKMSDLMEEIERFRDSRRHNTPYPTSDQNNTTADANSEANIPISADVIQDDDTKLIMCMDSNGKYLDRRKLWDLDGTLYKKTFTLQQVEAVIDQDEICYNNLNYFLISVGCNDCDEKDAETVAEDMKNLILKLKSKFPQVKIIVGEITPRQDTRDEIVKDANVLINRLVKQERNVFVIRNSNLRNSGFTYHEDNKHISEDCIAKFASNIKHALRVAYGRRKYNSQAPNQRLPQSSPSNSRYMHSQQQLPQQQQQQQLQQQQQQQHLQQLLWYLNQLSHIT